MALGPAGTGKTFMSLFLALENITKKNSPFYKVVIVRSVVPTRDIGFLPGNINKKMDPWTRPIIDIFLEFFSQNEVDKMMQDGTIEISPLAYMRGRTFKNAFIIADEMQNATPNQMKMLLTRIGENSRMVVTGDLKQADRLEDNGLIEFIKLLKSKDNLKYVDIVNFGQKDIERHPAVKEILEIYGD